MAEIDPTTYGRGVPPKEKVEQVTVGGSVFERELESVGDGELKPELFTRDELINMVSDDRTIMFQSIFTALQGMEIGASSAEPVLSFEMKQASKGQMYFDIKMSGIKLDEIDAALESYDKLHTELSLRVNGGE